jgi:hypothetical protein
MLREQYRASERVLLGVFWQTMHLSALKILTADGAYRTFFEYLGRRHIAWRDS